MNPKPSSCDTNCMRPFTPLVLVAILGTSLPAASSMILDPGSTRDWIKYTGPGIHSVRYHLEFLDSTSWDTSYPVSYMFRENDSNIIKTVDRRDSFIDWPVRITIPDSPSVVDTALFRYISIHIPLELYGSKGDYRIHRLACWARTSPHFPIDLERNPQEEMEKAYTLFGRWHPHFVTGAWEVSVSRGAGSSSTTTGISGDSSLLGDADLWYAYAYSTPRTLSSEGIGITAWLSRDSYWRLQTADGLVLPSAQGYLGHRLQKGESWVYRDSSRTMFPRDSSTAFVALELLDTPSDSSGWIRLNVRKSVRPDTGKHLDTTLAIRLDTLHHFVRCGSDLCSPWSLPGTQECNWGLGLMTHILHPEDSTSRYWKYSSNTEGEVQRSTWTDSFDMRLHTDIGATSILSKTTSKGVMNGTSLRSWTLVAHSLDNTILPTAARTPLRSRNLSWLRDRIAHDPSLEIVRIAPDGSSTRARGAEASKLLEARGVGFVQLRDGQKLVTLRIIRP